jgi:hypothetical protein
VHSLERASEIEKQGITAENVLTLQGNNDLEEGTAR